MKVRVALRKRPAAWKKGPATEVTHSKRKRGDSKTTQECYKLVEPARKESPSSFLLFPSETVWLLLHYNAANLKKQKGGCVIKKVRKPGRVTEPAPPLRKKTCRYTGGGATPWKSQKRIGKHGRCWKQELIGLPSKRGGGKTPVACPTRWQKSTRW